MVALADLISFYETCVPGFSVRNSSPAQRTPTRTGNASVSGMAKTWRGESGQVCFGGVVAEQGRGHGGRTTIRHVEPPHHAAGARTARRGDAAPRGRTGLRAKRDGRPGSSPKPRARLPLGSGSAPAGAEPSSGCPHHPPSSQPWRAFGTRNAGPTHQARGGIQTSKRRGMVTRGGFRGGAGAGLMRGGVLPRCSVHFAR